MVGHDDLHAYRAIQQGLHANGNEWVSLHRNYDPAEVDQNRGHGDRHQRDLDAQPVPRLGALHDADDVRRRCHPAKSCRQQLIELRAARGAPARRDALRRVERAVHRRRHLLGAAGARPARRAAAHVALVRGQAAARAADRTPEEPARVLAATAQPQPSPAAGAEPSSSSMRRPTASSRAARSTTPRRKTTRSISSSAPCFTTCACATARCASRLKRVNLLNCDAALPAVQLFI